MLAGLDEVLRHEYICLSSFLVVRYRLFFRDHNLLEAVSVHHVILRVRHNVLGEELVLLQVLLVVKLQFVISRLPDCSVIEVLRFVFGVRASFQASQHH